MHNPTGLCIGHRVAAYVVTLPVGKGKGKRWVGQAELAQLNMQTAYP